MLADVTPMGQKTTRGGTVINDTVHDDIDQTMDSGAETEDEPDRDFE